MSNRIRRRQTKGIIAGACGVAILLTGGTFALWHDQGAVAGGLITAGNLEIMAGSPEAWDISTNYIASAYRLDQSDTTSQNLTNRYVECKVAPEVAPTGDVMGHEINFAAAGTAWHPVPGDQFLIAYPLRIALQGDNMVANLKADLSGASLALEGGAITDLQVSLCVKGHQTKDFEEALVVDAVRADGTALLATLEAANEPAGLPETEPGFPGENQGILMVDDAVLPADPNAWVFLSGWFEKRVGGLEEDSTGDSFFPPGVNPSVGGTMYATEDVFAFLGDVFVTLEQTRSNIGHFQ